MNIQIDLKKQLGEIKRMNATGQAPLNDGMGYKSFDLFHLLSDISVPYVRLHDVGGLFGGNCYVDIPNIFRNFDADENDPASYDFAFTDAYITALLKNGLKPYYRLGVTIENNAEIRSYHIDPPKDYDKWACICEHIVAHYNEGWADGFHYDIEYWEIWNEPDDGMRISQMWNGTAEDYYRLYDVTSKHLKAKFPNIKVGGFASCGFYAISNQLLGRQSINGGVREQYFLDFFHGFMKYIKAHNSPIDFFSFHTYSNPKELLIQANYLDEQLKAYGYDHIERHLNEWNPPSRTKRASGVHSAEVAAIMLGAQNTSLDMLMIYDARLTQGAYNAFFAPCASGVELGHAYYAFAAFATLQKLGHQVALDCDTEEVYALCASNGENHAIMISNISGSAQKLNIEGVDLSNARWHILDDRRLLSWSAPLNTVENNTVLLIEF